MVAGKTQKNVNSTTENVEKRKQKKQPERWLQQKKQTKNSTSSVCPRRGSGH